MKKLRSLLLLLIVTLVGASLVPVASAAVVCSTPQLIHTSEDTAYAITSEAGPGTASSVQFFPFPSHSTYALPTGPNQLVSLEYAVTAYTSSNDGVHAAVGTQNILTNRYAITLTDLSSSVITNLVAPVDEVYAYPDVEGNYVAFAYGHDIGLDEVIDLMVYNITTGVMTNATNFTENGNDLVSLGLYDFVEVDGDNVLFMYYDAVAMIDKIAVYNITSNTYATIPNPHGNDVVFPSIDGDVVIFNGQNAGGFDSVYHYSISAGGNATVVADGTAEIEYIATDVSNGNVLLFSYDGEYDLLLKSVNGGSTTTIVSDFQFSVLYDYPKVAGDFVVWTQNMSYVPPSPPLVDFFMPKLDLTMSSDDVRQTLENRASSAVRGAGQDIINARLYQISTGEITEIGVGDPGTPNPDDEIYYFHSDVHESGTITYLKIDTSLPLPYKPYLVGCDGGTPSTDFFLQSPSDGAVVTDPTSVTSASWTDAGDALIYGFHLFQTSTNTKSPVTLFKSVVPAKSCVAGTCTIAIDLTGLPDGQYAWNVTAYTFFGNRSSLNGTYGFTLDTGADGIVDLIVNGNFESSLDSAWSAKNGAKIKCDTPDKTIALGGSCALQLKSGAKVVQNANLSGVSLTTSDVLNFLAYANAPASGGKLKVRVIYVDGSLAKGKINANVTAGGGYASYAGSTTIAGTVSKIKTVFNYKGVSGKMFVDNASLIVGDVPALAVGAEAIPLPSAPDGFNRNN